MRRTAFAVPCVLVVLNAAASCGGHLGNATGNDGGGPVGDDQLLDSAPPPYDAGSLPDVTAVDVSLPPPDATEVDAYDAGVAYGLIYFENGGFGQNVQGSFFAEFYEGPTGLFTGCTLTGQSGGCSAYQCPGASPIDAGAMLSAGVLTISGGSLPAGGVPVTLAPGTGYSYTAPGSIYTPGQTMTVSASGATVPAFDQTVVGLGIVTLTTPPSPGVGGSYLITTSQDLATAWTGGAAGAQVWIYFTTSGGPNQTFAYCSFDATAGQGIVPQPLLALFKGSSGFMSAIHTNPSTFAAGTFPTQIASLAYNFSQVTFQ
jgi:hypothetical protein